MQNPKKEKESTGSGATVENNQKQKIIIGSLVALVTLLSILLTRQNIFSRERNRVE